VETWNVKRVSVEVNVSISDFLFPPTSSQYQDFKGFLNDTILVSETVYLYKFSQF